MGFLALSQGTDYTKNSDVDIVIFKHNFKSGLDIVRAKNFLEKNLNVSVDIGTFKSLKNFVKQKIKEDIVNV
ncbi:nucleotidyltransferase family protein [Caminibacter sp.]